MKGSLFFRTRVHHYAVICLTALLSMLFAIGGIYFWVRENLINRNIMETVSGLEYIMENHISVFEQADVVLNMVASDQGITNLLGLMEQADYTECYRTYQRLEAISAQYEFIDNITTYDLQRQKIVATDWGLSDIRTYPKGAIPQLENTGQDRVLHIDTTSCTEGGVNLRIGRYFPLGYVYTPKSYISLTLNTSYLTQLYEHMMPDGGEFFLLHGQDLIYASTPVPDELLRLANEAYQEPDGILVKEIILQDKKQLSVQVCSKGYGLIFSYQIPMEIITKDVHFMTNILFVLFFGIILLLSVTGIFSIRILFRPIERIRNVVACHEIDAPLDIRDLPEHIQKVYDGYQTMEQCFDQYKGLQKNSFLHEMIFSSAIKEDCSEELSYFQLPFHLNSHYCVVLLSQSKNSKLTIEKTIQQTDLFVFCMIQTFQAALQNAIAVESVIGDDHDQYLIFCIDGIQNPACLQEITTLFLQTITAVHQKVTANMGNALTVGVSSILKGIASLPSCRRQAETARDLRWLNGVNQVIIYEETEGLQENSYPYEIEKKVLASLKSNQRQQAEEYLLQFHQYVLQHTEMDIGISKHYYLQLLTMTYRSIYDSYSFCLNAIPSEQQCYTDFVNAPSAEELFERLCSLYEILFTQMERQHSKRYTKISEEACRYIQKYYQQDLSLDMIAEALKISSSHLRRVFHEETGESVKNYLDQVRIQNAQRLLCQTDKRINDIAVETGYISIQTFVRVFKKETGFTPSEYRRIEQTKISNHSLS